MAVFELAADRAHVLAGLRTLRLPRNVRAGNRAVVSFDGRCAFFEAFGQSFWAAASGAWPGNAYVNASLVAALARVPPTGDPLIIRCNRALLTIGATTVGCQWRPVSDMLMRAPAARDWLVSLSLPHR